MSTPSPGSCQVKAAAVAASNVAAHPESTTPEEPKKDEVSLQDMEAKMGAAVEQTAEDTTTIPKVIVEERMPAVDLSTVNLDNTPEQAAKAEADKEAVEAKGTPNAKLFSKP